MPTAENDNNAAAAAAAAGGAEGGAEGGAKPTTTKRAREPTTTTMSFFAPMLAALCASLTPQRLLVLATYCSAFHPHMHGIHDSHSYMSVLTRILPEVPKKFLVLGIALLRVGLRDVYVLPAANDGLLATCSEVIGHPEGRAAMRGFFCVAILQLRRQLRADPARITAIARVLTRGPYLRGLFAAAADAPLRALEICQKTITFAGLPLLDLLLRADSTMLHLTPVFARALERVRTAREWAAVTSFGPLHPTFLAHLRPRDDKPTICTREGDTMDMAVLRFLRDAPLMFTYTTLDAPAASVADADDEPNHMLLRTELMAAAPAMKAYRASRMTAERQALVGQAVEEHERQNNKRRRRCEHLDTDGEAENAVDETAAFLPLKHY